MKRISCFALSALLIIAVFISLPIQSKDFAGVYAASTVERSGLNISDENLYNESENLHDKKVYDTTRLEDEFADDTISVVLNRQASRSLNTYTIKDFPELRLGQVKHVAMHAEENVRQQLLEMKNKNIPQITKQNNYTSQRGDSNININTFRQRVRLTLKEPGKENVLKAIKLLEKK